MNSRLLIVLLTSHTCASALLCTSPSSVASGQESCHPSGSEATKRAYYNVPACPAPKKALHIIIALFPSRSSTFILLPAFTLSQKTVFASPCVPPPPLAYIFFQTSSGGLFNTYVCVSKPHSIKTCDVFCIRCT